MNVRGGKTAVQALGFTQADEGIKLKHTSDKWKKITVSEHSLFKNVTQNQPMTSSQSVCKASTVLNILSYKLNFGV